MLLRFFTILLLYCFAASTICVPEGDFSLLTQLPAFYQHCKATEDADINFIDFITEHLINIDSIFGKLLFDKDDKPHQPFIFHILHTVAFVAAYVRINIIKPAFQLKELFLFKNCFFCSDYIVYVFHPPDNGAASLTFNKNF